MVNSAPKVKDSLTVQEQLRRLIPNEAGFRQRLGLLRWLIPFGMVFLVIVYEVGPSRWVYERLGFAYHLAAEIVLFGTVGPVLVFVLLELLGRWIDEKETADFQANLLANAQMKELEARQINDDTIQVLFATSLLITNFKTDQTDLPPSTAIQIEVTEQALHDAMQRLRSHIMS
jgi:hypothetical protein